jgi:hypothetical protein
MSFYTGTQCELLYAMPTASAAVTASGQTIMSKGSAAAPYVLPANFFVQQSGGGPGKSIELKGGGFFTVGTTAITDVIQFALDSTPGTYNAGGLFASTGTLTTLVSITTGVFFFDILVTAQVMGTSGTLSAVGTMNFGAGGAAETFGTNGSTLSTFNQSVVVGLPATGVTSFSTQTSYAVEIFNTWSAATGGPSITLTNFYVFGLN